MTLDMLLLGFLCLFCDRELRDLRDLKSFIVAFSDDFSSLET